MTKLLLVSFFILISNISICQSVWKFKAKYVSFTTKEHSGDWSDFIEPIECNVLIVFNTENETLKVYSSEEQEYSVYKSEVSESTEEINFNLNCIDKEGQKCQVEITKYSNPVDTGKITVFYPNKAWVYLVVWL